MRGVGEYDGGFRSFGIWFKRFPELRAPFLGFLSLPGPAFAVAGLFFLVWSLFLSVVTQHCVVRKALRETESTGWRVSECWVVGGGLSFFPTVRRFFVHFRDVINCVALRFRLIRNGVLGDIFLRYRGRAFWGCGWRADGISWRMLRRARSVGELTDNAF